MNNDSIIYSLGYELRELNEKIIIKILDLIQGFMNQEISEVNIGILLIKCISDFWKMIQLELLI